MVIPSETIITTRYSSLEKIPANKDRYLSLELNVVAAMHNYNDNLLIPAVTIIID
ncbi:MAG: hypothetical protein ACTMUB_06200 [cyanobacterium endosymbiont of Rhopalodia musculus]|uniref:hypothetical protein n=1 Tax=cyanobacterium endosymbiont of Epithemia clementina EcSB TaxID=3034674 RepID=UPI00248197C1|nr:hypothetical protein [cyanobacterium endosymbiont of Epithemia clementina EcSB]WGT67726.1 hypothetical protein P3F56_01055 [cyanobacterium endosymbiont of Epithemia clementina EcSB]